VDGFGITNGVRGIDLWGAKATIKDSAIYGNDNSASNGGGVDSGHGNDFLTLINCAVYDNSAINGAGLYFNQGSFVIIDSTIRNNTATGDGGGLWLNGLDGKTNTITGSTFTLNSAGDTGGGLHLTNGIGIVNIDKSIISTNSSGTRGGGIYKENSIRAAVTNSIISDNGSGAEGGAIASVGSSIGSFSLINTTLAGNDATTYGGAIYTYNGDYNPCNFTIRNSVFWNNVAAGAGSPGHNIYIYNVPASIGTLSDSDVATTAGIYFVNVTWEDGANLLNVDPQFVGGGDYHIQATSPVIDQANDTYAPSDDIDGDSRTADAGPDMGADEFTGGAGANNAPELAWSSEAGYTTDGIDPDAGLSGTDFNFRVTYTDPDNAAPALIELWIDQDDNGVFGPAEKHAMTQVVEDGDFANGEDFVKTLSVNAGDGTINYFFHAHDGSDQATGAPTLVQTLVFANNAPTLYWTGEAGYESDGVEPPSAEGGSDFTFRIDYADSDNHGPVSIQVWIDLDGSGMYDPGEKFDMVYDSGDGFYTDGERYTLTRSIPYIGDGMVMYRFYGSDGTAVAAGDPTLNYPLTVTPPAVNAAPVLSWITGESCLAAGVRPQVGASGGDFEFMVNYTDSDDQCPDVIQVWVDADQNGIYGDDEKYALATGDPSACSGGRVYTATVPVAVENEGDFNYRFYATDGLEGATGAPVAGDTLEILNALRVRPWEGGAGEGLFWYNSIQDAVNVAGDPSTILVWPNSDFTAATYSERVQADSRDNVIIRSVCGPDLTAIDATGIAEKTVLFLDSSNNVLDGFTVTGATDLGLAGSESGVNLLRAPGAIVRNNRIVGNPIGIDVNETADCILDNNLIDSNTRQGVNAHTGSNTTITGSTITHNGSAAGSDGAGIYYNGGVHTVSDSTISYNSAMVNGLGTGRGGGIHFNGVGAGTTVSNTVIADNSAAINGGGFYVGGNNVVFEKTTFTANHADGIGGAGYLGGGVAAFTNTIFGNNSADNSGGGVGENSGSYTFVNCTFADNAAVNRGGGLDICNAFNFIKNSLFRGNTAPDGYDAGNCSGASGYLGEISYTMIDDVGINQTYTDSGGIIAEQDPLFIADYRIQTGSPAIDRGDAAGAPDDDIDGDFRPQYAAHDLGADEVADPAATIPGDATAAATGIASIEVSMPYAGDGNGSNTYSVDYKLGTDTEWTNEVTGAPHTASPYAVTITDLLAGETYAVRATYNDGDGVAGENPQLLDAVTLPLHATTVGAATAVRDTSTSIRFSMPYTGDDNANNTYTIDYKLSTDGSWINWGYKVMHRSSPYEATINGLVDGAIYDVRLIYNDLDGITNVDDQEQGFTVDLSP
jgi:parallel beta-helix repeat protein